MTRFSEKVTGNRTDSSVGEFFHDHRGIVATKTEAIAHGGPDFALLGNVGRIIQIAFRVGIIQINRGRH